MIQFKSILIQFNLIQFQFKEKKNQYYLHICITNDKKMKIKDLILEELKKEESRKKVCLVPLRFK